MIRHIGMVFYGSFTGKDPQTFMHVTIYLK